MWFVKPKVKRVCQKCGREFKGREDAKFCSSACRQAAYRSRKLQTERRAA